MNATSTKKNKNCRNINLIKEYNVGVTVELESSVDSQIYREL